MNSQKPWLNSSSKRLKRPQIMLPATTPTPMRYPTEHFAMLVAQNLLMNSVKFSGNCQIFGRVTLFSLILLLRQSREREKGLTQKQLTFSQLDDILRDEMRRRKKREEKEKKKEN